MDKYIQTDREGLVKDRISGAILNVDNAKLDAYKKQKQQAEQARASVERINKMENDIFFNRINKFMEGVKRKGSCKKEYIDIGSNINRSNSLIKFYKIFNKIGPNGCDFERRG